MAVRKFRTLDEARDALWLDRDDPHLMRKLAWVLGLGERLGTVKRPRPGVRKYRSLEDAQRDRDGW